VGGGCLNENQSIWFFFPRFPFLFLVFFSSVDFDLAVLDTSERYDIIVLCTTAYLPLNFLYSFSSVVAFFPHRMLFQCISNTVLTFRRLYSLVCYE